MGKITFLLVLILPLFVFSKDRVRNICGEYIYYAPSDVSVDEAKVIAVERARISALADEFGTLLSQNNLTVIKNENGESSTDFKSLSASEVKGEWLKDTKAAQTQVSYELGMLVVKANVCGEAREITRAAINFEARILSNGKEDQYESDEFNEGSDFYLSFQSPVSGYLAIYLVDDEQTAFCLLPYSHDADGKVNVESGQQYLFFDSKSVPENDRGLVDEFKLACSKYIESNQVFIIFSPNSFIKANDNKMGSMLPRELSFPDFQRWLTKNRNIDSEMQIEIKTIKIRKQKTP
jgi:hypothetical protein